MTVKYTQYKKLFHSKIMWEENNKPAILLGSQFVVKCYIARLKLTETVDINSFNLMYSIPLMQFKTVHLSVEVRRF